METKITTRRWKKIAGPLGGLAVFAFGAIGLLHTSAARPLLMKLGGCPVGNASPAVVEAGRRDVVRATRGQDEATSRPALGFALDDTSIDGVRSWAAKAGVSCEEKREGTLLQCKDVPAHALSEPSSAGLSAPSGARADATIDDVSFGFTVEGKRLVNVTTLSSNLQATEAAARMNAITDALSTSLGEPTLAAGDRTASHLADMAFATAIVEYRFHDYIADVTSTAVPGRGVVLREHYMSARL